MNSPPLQPWVGVNKDGEIICAYCNCLPAAGEACSHIAAVLYVIMAGVKLEETSCTSVKSKWLAPALTKRIHCFLY